MIESICFAIAGLSFLTVGILGGFRTINIVLTALFALNAIIFFSLKKMKTTRTELIAKSGTELQFR